MKSALVPPSAFGCVESGVYRADTPRVENLPFLRTLRLKSVVTLSLETQARAVRTHYLDTIPNVVKLGEKFWTVDGGSTVPSVNVDLVVRALEMILDTANHPILVCCATGRVETGAVIGCLRRLQNWCVSSALQEYQAFAEGIVRTEVMQTIEFFDRDLVRIPSSIESLPVWYAVHEEQTREEHVELTQRSEEYFPRFTKHDSRPAYVAFKFKPNCPALSCRATYDPKESLVAEDDD